MFASFLCPETLDFMQNFVKVKKSQKIFKKLLTFSDLCANITIEGQRKSKTNTD